MLHMSLYCSPKIPVGEILKEGVGGFIQKPYRDEELIGKVRAILDSPMEAASRPR